MSNIIRRLWDSVLILTYTIIVFWIIAAAIKFLPVASVGEILGSTLGFTALLFGAKLTHYWGIWIVTGKGVNNEKA